MASDRFLKQSKRFTELHKAGFSRKELAKEFSINETTVSRWLGRLGFNLKPCDYCNGPIPNGKRWKFKVKEEIHEGADRLTLTFLFCREKCKGKWIANE